VAAVKPVVLTWFLWVVAAVFLIGWLAGLVTLRLDEREWSHVVPAPVKHTCTGLYARAWCP
jgi:hypothetical protein